MASIVSPIVNAYRHVFEDITDPRTRDWFLTGTPWPILGILVCYLYFINSLGPRLMANRPPFKLDRVLQVYNVAQIVISTYLFYKGLVLGWWNTYNYRCEPVDYSESKHALQIAGMVWFYFMVKILDLLDTIFFVLRKKQNQVSFLHVYHHTGMVIATWGGVKYLAGGHITFLGQVNSFVHIIMYSHYLATSLKLGKPWWKKYITQLQIFQFFLILVHFAQLLWVEDCGFPLWPAYMFIPQNLFMIYLFGKFYYHTYIEKKEKPNRSTNGFTNNKTFNEDSNNSNSNNDNNNNNNINNKKAN